MKLCKIPVGALLLMICVSQSCHGAALASAAGESSPAVKGFKTPSPYLVARVLRAHCPGVTLEENLWDVVRILEDGLRHAEPGFSPQGFRREVLHLATELDAANALQDDFHRGTFSSELLDQVLALDAAFKSRDALSGIEKSLRRLVNHVAAVRRATEEIRNIAWVLQYVRKIAEERDGEDAYPSWHRVRISGVPCSPIRVVVLAPHPYGAKPKKEAAEPPQAHEQAQEDLAAEPPAKPGRRSRKAKYAKNEHPRDIAHRGSAKKSGRKEGRVHTKYRLAARK